MENKYEKINRITVALKDLVIEINKIEKFLENRYSRCPEVSWK